MAEGLPRDATGLRKLKAMGFSDKRLAYLALQSAHLPGGARGAAYGSGLIHDTVKAMTGGVTEAEVRALRHRLGVRPVFKAIDTCAAEFAARTPYLYSTYEAPTLGQPENEAHPSSARKIVILGRRQNRLGPGTEVDTFWCRALFPLAESGCENKTI